VKAAPIIAGIAGLAAIGGLVAYFGAGAVMRTLLAIGWGGFAAVCLIQLVLIAAMGIAWRALAPGAAAWVFAWGRLMRDAGSEVLPLSQMGGCILGARAVAIAGVPNSIAAASTIVDITLEFLAKLVYTALGLILLVQLRPASPVAVPVLLGLAVAGLIAVALIVVQRRGFDLFDRFARVLGRGWADRTATGAAAVHLALTRIHRRKTGLRIGFGLHLGCWVASAVQAWIALSLAGSPLDFSAVLVVESLVYAIRTVSFAIPNSVGVQEGAYLLLGATFGLTPEMALALSLLKRARDLAIGLPALGVWQAVEGGRLWRRKLASAGDRSILGGKS
jgi:glycosyltransferase 2 family protein